MFSVGDEVKHKITGCVGKVEAIAGDKLVIVFEHNRVKYLMPTCEFSISPSVAVAIVHDILTKHDSKPTPISVGTVVINRNTSQRYTVSEESNEEAVKVEDRSGKIFIFSRTSLAQNSPHVWPTSGVMSSEKAQEIDGILMGKLPLSPEEQYLELANRLMKDPALIRGSLTDRHVDLIHATMGICGEAGELLDAIKKHVIYGKELDLENVTEELGDLNFYITRLMWILGITREATLEHNMVKLNKRYAKGYSDKAAQERADKTDVVEEVGASSEAWIANSGKQPLADNIKVEWKTVGGDSGVSFTENLRWTITGTGNYDIVHWRRVEQEWIGCDGTKPVFLDHRRIKVKFRDGDTAVMATDTVVWEHRNKGWDVVAYQLV